MNIDNLVNNILDSYDKYGLINRNDAENFPNRQNVVAILSDIQSLIFPGFRVAEEMNPVMATFWTVMNVFGNGVKKIFYVKKYN